MSDVADAFFSRVQGRNEMFQIGVVDNLHRIVADDLIIIYNLYIHLYGDGFDEMYEALVGNGW